MQDSLCGMYAPQGRLTRRALKATFRGKHEVLLPEGMAGYLLLVQWVEGHIAPTLYMLPRLKAQFLIGDLCDGVI